MRGICLRCDNWSINYFCDRVLLMCHSSSHINLFLLLFLNLVSRKIVVTENMGVHFTYSMYISYFILMIFHVPAQCTFNDPIESFWKRGRQERWKIWSAKQERKAQHISCQCETRVWDVKLPCLKTALGVVTEAKITSVVVVCLHFHCGSH